MIYRLPVELLDITLDHLHDDVPSLKNSSLTCSSWLPTCRLHLWGTVIVKDRDLIPGLIQILVASPPIVCIIKNLTFYDGHNLPDEWQDVPFDPVDFANVWPYVSKSRSTKMKYSYITPHLEFPFRSLNNLYLAGVRFGSFSHALKFLSSVPSITSISLVRVYYPPDTYLQESMIHKLCLPNLLHLCLNTPQADEFLIFFQSFPRDEMKISSLEVHEQEDEPILRLTGLLHATAHTLESIKFVVSTKCKSNSLQSYSNNLRSFQGSAPSHL